MVEPIHDALVQQDSLPSTHVVDGGYMDADAIVTSRTKHNVVLFGPVALENRGPRQIRRCLRSLALPHRLAEPEGHLSYRTTQLLLDAHPRIAVDKRSSTPSLLLRRVSVVQAESSVPTGALVG